MKYLYLVLICAFFPIVFVSCSKSDSRAAPNPAPTPPGKIIITSVSPNRDSLYLGSVVTVTGQNFITDTSKVTLRINDHETHVTSITTESFTFTIPADLTQLKPGEVKGYNLNIIMEGRETSYLPITIRYHEPQGWYYATTLSSAPLQTGKLITFSTDLTGFVLGEFNIYRTTDGGMTWTNVSSSGRAQTFASFDGQHAWFDFATTVGVSNDGILFQVNTNGFRFDRSIVGLYMTSPTTGLVASQDQNLYYINGGFTPDKITVKFRSKYFTYDPAVSTIKSNWGMFSVLDESNLMLTGFAEINGVRTCIITHEKAGVFTEYDLGAVTSAPYAKGIQLIDANTAYLIDGNNDLLKFTGGTTWIKLNQKATAICFVNASTGYAAYDGKILKTSDGGTSWQTEFTLQAGEIIKYISSRNNKIWAVVNNATDLRVLKYNP